MSDRPGGGGGPGGDSGLEDLQRLLAALFAGEDPPGNAAASPGQAPFPGAPPFGGGPPFGAMPMGGLFPGGFGNAFHGGRPAAVVVNSQGAGGDERTGGGNQVLLMSIPGIGIVGTGLPADLGAGLNSAAGAEGGAAAAGAPGGGSTDGGAPEMSPADAETLQRAMRAAMEEVMRVVAEQGLAPPPEASQAPPANESLRDALPRVVITKQDQMDAGDPKCAVCLEDYKIGARATRMLCGHLFCTTCIREWLRTTNSCPICRFELATDREDFESGRRERMQGRRMYLKSGELKMMRVPELKKLMRALRVSGEGCVEKSDLIRRLGEVPDMELAEDRRDVSYLETELQDMDMPHLRNLMERHGLKKLPGDMPEDDERTEALEVFVEAGWMSRRQTSAPKSPKQKEAPVETCLRRSSSGSTCGSPLSPSQGVVRLPSQASIPVSEPPDGVALERQAAALAEELQQAPITPERASPTGRVGRVAALRAEVANAAAAAAAPADEAGHSPVRKAPRRGNSVPAERSRARSPGISPTSSGASPPSPVPISPMRPEDSFDAARRFRRRRTTSSGAL